MDATAHNLTVSRRSSMLKSMSRPPRQKLYAYTDETGQDTKGTLFIVTTVLAGNDRDDIRARLHEIERASRKRDKKWTKSRPEQRVDYIRRILDVSALHGAMYYSQYRDTRSYVDLTILSTAKAVLARAREPYQATILMDGLGWPERRRFAAELRKLHVAVDKVRGLKDQADAFIRLADALAGFVRAGLVGHPVLSDLFEQAKRERIIKEA